MGVPITNTSDPSDIGSRRCFHIGFTKLPQGMPFRCGTPPEQVLSIQGFKARLGELAAALGGVNPHSRQPVELLDAQNDRLAVPVGRQQIAGVILVTLALDVDAVSPVAGTGGQEQI